MITGVSSACYYPLETEKALKRCGELGFKNVEIFVNSPCEMSGEILGEIKSIIAFYGLNVCSVHPFTSFSESFVIFGSYPRRVTQGIEYYKRFFEFGASLGAQYFILHGGNVEHTVNGEEYFERYARLCAAANPFGVTVTHENVVRHRAETPEFMKALSDYVGDSFRMTLDIKQCRRAGELPQSFIDLLGDKISNVHISDFNDGCDCIAPFEGSFNFENLFAQLKNKGYSGKYLIELYSSGFDNGAQLVAAAQRTDMLLKNII